MKTMVGHTWSRSFISITIIGAAKKLTWFIGVALLMMWQPTHAANSFGTNLIENFGAELGLGSATGEVVNSIPLEYNRKLHCCAVWCEWRVPNSARPRVTG